MLGIVGTVPKEDFPMTCGRVESKGDHLLIKGRQVEINRGTPSMIAAAVETLKYMNQSAPYCYLVGDVGDGKGCEKLYRHLIDTLDQTSFNTISFHYFQPDVHRFRDMMKSIDKIKKRPTLIADAGFMYVAKMAGLAPSFDLFTPDAGELAYLADEKAPHPFYTRGFILHEENLVPDLIRRAYEHGNAAVNLLVKGEKDHIANQKGILSVVEEPSEENLEPIGGTGDTLTGIVSGLIASGMDLLSACIVAAKTNRIAGAYARPTPASQIHQIIKYIPRALEELIDQ
ncbi:NAD(P)H-hydrate dehydratase [Alkalibacter mobilis]|uniref:NAD(P)H-hydrate dehydratase n=1 Tax=Alkalibacter mobilis TaxID=2787712 RepID=UPI0018A041AE|nr:NAD(P)H-hydrate dehydratase [Alkalibacter mobilis]MBF7096288.1 sugar kinase [Alkalibacter mobilis]